MTLNPSHGGVVFGNHEYLLYQQDTVWTGAEYTCRRQGGRLVSIESAEENEFIRKMIPATASHVWIGATKQSGDWMWVDGTPLSCSNWNTGEPNGAASGETTVEMLTTGRWNDLSATGSMPYICEWEVQGERTARGGTA